LPEVIAGYGIDPDSDVGFARIKTDPTGKLVIATP